MTGFNEPGRCLVDAVIDAREAEYQAGHYGSFVLRLGPRYRDLLDERYHYSRPMTVADRILTVDGILSIVVDPGVRGVVLETTHEGS